MSEFIFRKYEDKDKEQVLALLGDNLWHFPYEERLAYFNWKYEQNPYTDKPMGFVCEDGDKIIAFRGYMLVPLILEGKVFHNAALADTVTDKNYRRMGLFSRVTKYSTDYLDKLDNVLVSTNSSSGGPTLNGYLKLGWQKLEQRGNRFSFTWRSFMPNKEISHNQTYKVRNGDIIEISDVCKFEEISALAKQKEIKNKVSINNDLEYVKWRYSNPNAKYIYAYYYKDEKLAAFVILKEIGHRKYDIINYEFNEKYQLKALLKNIHKTLSPIYILNWISNVNDRINANLFYYGFVSLDFILLHIKKFRIPPFLVRLMDDSEEKWSVDNIDFRKSINWNLDKSVADEI